jgi:hypothetical protein
MLNSYEDIEWNIVDCHSNDGIHDFMVKFYSDDKTSDNLKNKVNYYQCLDKIDYHIPIFKNMAARLSKNDYLFNLDIDNYLEHNLINNIIEKGINNGVCCNKGFGGTFGRIGCSATNFKTVGGYDENFLPAAIHESDFISRSGKNNYFFNHVDCSIRPVQNSKKETTENFNIKLPKRWSKNGRRILIDWREMYNVNIEKAKYNLDNKVINPNKKHAKCTFLFNFKSTVKLTEEY